MESAATRRLAGRPTRRTFLLTLGVMAGAGLWRPRVETVVARPRFAADPFTLGVASGDPGADGAVLWTRLAPDPLQANGGMPAEPVELAWEVAGDDSFRDVVRTGRAVALPEFAHAVHVEVVGLAPGRPYWYRFRAGEATSRAGRTVTAPAPGGLPERFRFAFASCQNWQHGFFNAHRDLAQQAPDLVLHLGDYIYENRLPENGGARNSRVPAEFRPEPRTLEQYRLRYTLYKLDPNLQAAHAAAPWVVTWDDHEVVNDYAGDTAPGDRDPAAFLRRRAAAYRAYYEHQPLRPSARPDGPNARVFRRLAFGDLFDLHVLDTRQYRTPQPPGCPADERAAFDGYCVAALDPAQTILGADQRSWLLDGFAGSSARWNVVANQVPFARRDLSVDPDVHRYAGDKWDGYAEERDAVLAAMAELAANRPFRPVFVTGDVHANYVFDLPRDWHKQSPEGVVGVEFVGTSISSNGDEPLSRGGFATRCGPTANNPHNPFFDDHRGYVLCTLTPDRCTADYRVVPTVRDPNAPAASLARFVVEADRVGAQAESGC